jgi:small subunit ribosomal protein S8
MYTDPIGDFIIRIKNAGRVGKDSVAVPFSKMKFAIAELLSKKGFVGAVSKKSKGNSHTLHVELIYKEDGSPKVYDVQRISKPSRRLYSKSKDINRFRRGFGMSVFSTPKGIMADVDAKKENLGGEFLFNVW